MHASGVHLTTFDHGLARTEVRTLNAFLPHVGETVLEEHAAAISDATELHIEVGNVRDKYRNDGESDGDKRVGTFCRNVWCRSSVRMTRLRSPVAMVPLLPTLWPRVFVPL